MKKNFFQKIIPTVPKHYLLLIASVVWAFAGVMLLTKGIGFLKDNSTHIVWKIIVSLVAGVVFFRLMFTRISYKHIKRIKTLPTERPTIFAFFNAKSYIMMFSMISLGIFLRKTEIIPIIYLAPFYVTMGTPLLLSSVRFMYAFLK